jgi:tRNA G10  N-methylase Trm11
VELDVVHCGDCLEVLREMPDQSIDAVITDPPYAEVKRDYGRWTEQEWWALIVEGVVPEVRRVLKPTGSAVFIILVLIHALFNSLRNYYTRRCGCCSIIFKYIISSCARRRVLYIFIRSRLSCL